jgi:hypothetical protein
MEFLDSTIGIVIISYVCTHICNIICKISAFELATELQITNKLFKSNVTGKNAIKNHVKIC